MNDRNLRVGLSAAGVSLLLTFSAMAQEGGMAGSGAPPGTVEADELTVLVARALSSAPGLAAQRARLSAAWAALPAAGVPDDPMVEFEYRDAGFPRQTLGRDPMTMTGITVRQPLLGPARRGSREKLAAAGAGLEHAATDRVACDLTAAVRAAYAQVYLADRERAILRDANELASLLAATTAARYAAGSSDQTAVLRSQIEQSRLREREADLEAERAIAVATLNRLVGQPVGTPLGEVRRLPSLPPLPGSLDRVADVAGTVAPDVAERAAGVDLASRRLDVANAELGASYTVGGGVFWQGGLDRVVTLTVGVDLPFRKNRRLRPMIAAAEHSLEAARQDLADARAGVEAEVARLVAELRRADSQIGLYQSALLPQSSAAFDAARASYLAGRGDFGAVLDEFRQWTGMRVELARREAARFTALSRLDVLVNPAEHGDWFQRAPGRQAENGKDVR